MPAHPSSFHPGTTRTERKIKIVRPYEYLVLAAGSGVWLLSIAFMIWCI